MNMNTEELESHVTVEDLLKEKVGNSCEIGQPIPGKGWEQDNTQLLLTDSIVNSYSMNSSSCLVNRTNRSIGGHVLD
jgi:hypothetical protein